MLERTRAYSSVCASTRKAVAHRVRHETIQKRQKQNVTMYVQGHAMSKRLFHDYPTIKGWKTTGKTVGPHPGHVRTALPTAPQKHRDTTCRTRRRHVEHSKSRRSRNCDAFGIDLRTWQAKSRMWIENLHRRGTRRTAGCSERRQ